MSSDDIDPESTVPWPGFVDILSTVIIVFVFFMMMTSVIIFVLSEQSKKAAVDEAVEQSTTEDRPELPPDIHDLIHERETLRKEIDKLTQMKNVLSESELQSTVLEGNTLTIVFGDMGATLKAQTTDIIAQTLPFQGKIQLTAHIPQGDDYSAIREVALNRALNIRNVLLQNNIPKEKIALKIASGKSLADESSKNPYGSVTIAFEY